MSATDRRAAFHSSKSIMSTGGDRRPPLVRAMSAPIRTLSTEDTKTTSKRRPIRRRRIGRDRSVDGFAESSPFILETTDEADERNDENLDCTKGRSLVARKPGNAARSKSALGVCDVITMVSQLSSGGSDSEKDEPIVQCVSYNFYSLNRSRFEFSYISE